MCRKYFNKLMHTARPLMDVQASTLKDGLRDRRRNIGIFPETDVCWLDMTHKSPVSTITMDPLELHCLGLARGAMLCLGTMASVTGGIHVGINVMLLRFHQSLSVEETSNNYMMKSSTIQTVETIPCKFTLKSLRYAHGV